MYIFGDIGNTETKIFLISINNRIIKKLILSSKDINHSNYLLILKLIIKKLRKYYFAV